MRLSTLVVILVALIAASLGLIALVCATADAQPAPVTQLSDIRIEPSKGLLTWMVQRGQRTDDGKFKPTSPKIEFRVDLKEAVMVVGGETRKFDAREVSLIWPHIEALMGYCHESTVWWDMGKGERVRGPGRT